MKKLVLSFLCSFLFPAFLHASITPKEIKTPLGLKVWYLQDTNTPVIALSFSFEGGAKTDFENKEGLASSAVAILGEGTREKDLKTVDEFLQDHAISLRFNASIDSIEGSLAMLTDHKEEAFDILRETLMSPRMNHETLEKVKKDLLTHLANIANDPTYMATRKLESLLFPNHPYGKPVLGTSVSIKKIKLQDIEAYLDQNMSQDRLTIAITGNISEDEVKSFVDKTFGGLPEKGKPLLENRIDPIIQGQLEPITLNIPQSLILFALPGIMYDDPDFIEASLLLHIMGGGQQSRLFQEIREKRGLAYAIAAGIIWNQEAGYFKGFLGTTFDKTGESIQLTQQEWKRLKEKGVSEEELKDAKTNMINSYPLRFTNSQTIATVLVGYQRSKRPIDYFQKREKMIEEVTVEDMNNFIKRIIQPDKLTFVVVGKALAQEKNSSKVS